MRATRRLDNIELWQDDKGAYWITVTSEVEPEPVRLGLSNMFRLNPDRIKLEAWAEEQLCKSEISN
jgi:hypothetical protein